MSYVCITQMCDAGNRGDHAILESEICMIKSLHKDVTISVLTLWPEELKRIEPDLEVHSPPIDLKVRGKYPPLFLTPLLLLLQVFLSIVSILLTKAGLRPIYRSDAIKQYENAQIFISSGHEPFSEGSLQETYSLYPKLTNLFMLFWGMYDVFVIKKMFKKRFMNFPQSMGPFRTRVGRIMARFILNNLDAILLREPYSLTFLKNSDTRRPIQVLADIAFLFESRSQFSVQMQKPVVGVSPCLSYGFGKRLQRRYIFVHSRLLDHLVVKYGFNVVFLPSRIRGGLAEIREKVPDDLRLCEMISENMVHKEKAKIIKVKNAWELNHFIAQLDLLVATRMHPTILAAINKVAFVPVVYEHKQIGLLKKLDLEDLAVKINDISYDKLQSRVESVLSSGQEIKNRLSLNVPILQEQIRTSITKALFNVLLAY